MWGKGRNLSSPISLLPTDLSNLETRKSKLPDPTSPQDPGILPLLSLLAQGPGVEVSSTPWTQTQKSRPPVPSYFRSPVSQALFPHQKAGRPPAPSSSTLRSPALKVSPAHSEPEFAQAQSGDSRTVGGTMSRTGRGQNPVLKTRGGPDPRSGTRRRLRGVTARLAQRRGRGPGGPQSAPRNPRGNGEAGGEARSAPKE